VLFDRQYRLLVGAAGQSRGLEITDLHISFEIKKTAKNQPNKSSIRVWNLQLSTRKELEKPDTRCIFYAGYREDAGPLLLFNGNTTFVWSRIEGPDIVTEFELGDGQAEMRDATVSVGYGPGVRSSQILADAAQSMELPLNVPGNAPERSYQQGFSYYGSATGLLDKVTQGTDLEWSVQNGNLQVIQQGMVTTRQGVELDLDSGLIYSPERMRKNRTEHKKRASARHQYDGWRVKTLLMPMLNPGDRIRLTSRFVQGIFRIQEIEHRGDSHEGDWISEIKLIDPALPLAGEDEATTKGGMPVWLEAS
jgi:hypothetical protein